MLSRAGWKSALDLDDQLRERGIILLMQPDGQFYIWPKRKWTPELHERVRGNLEGMRVLCLARASEGLDRP